MTTTHTSVTDAEVDAALKNYYKTIGQHSKFAMRYTLEQFAQSRQPSSEAVELPPLPEPDHAYDCGTTPFYNADQMRDYATAAIKAAHPQPAAPAGVTASKSASVTVTAEGVRFGKNCWYSHERITGYKPERLNLGACSLPARGYMEWVQANLQADTYAAPTVEEGIAALVDALAESKGWMRTYAEAIIKDAIDRKHLEDAAPVVDHALHTNPVVDHISPEVSYKVQIPDARTFCDSQSPRWAVTWDWTAGWDKCRELSHTTPTTPAEAARLAEKHGGRIENWLTNPPKPGLIYMKPKELAALIDEVRQAATAQTAPLKDNDVFTLIGHAEFLRLSGETDMPSFFLELAERMARAIGDRALAARCVELRGIAAAEVGKEVGG